MNILFFGTYQHKVDSKGRVSIPARWRRHLNGCCFTSDSTKFYKDLSSFDKVDLRYFSQYGIDKTGRTIVNKVSCIATMKGCGDYFTIEFSLDN